MNQLKDLLAHLPNFNWRVFLWGLPDELKADTTQTVAVITPASEGLKAHGGDEITTVTHRWGLQIYLTGNFKGDPTPLQTVLIKALEAHGYTINTLRTPVIDPVTRQITLSLIVSNDDNL